MEITENGFIDLQEFLPAGDTFVVQMLPVSTKKQAESGLYIGVNEDSVINDRPNFGRIVLVGPESKRKLNELVYVQKGMGYDLEMIRKSAGVEAYVLLYNDAVIGNRV